MTRAGDKPLDVRHVSVLWASIDHAQSLAELHATLFTDAPWDVSAFNGLLSQPASTSLVARIGNPPATIGFIMGRLVADEAEVVSLGVGTPWRRHGIGRRLVEGFARAAKRAEAKRMFLEVAADNVPATVLYSRLAFQEIGRRKAYYQRAAGPPMDALQLALTL
jgi:ribosomal-protein-alanine N-acetyltransferase